MIIVCASYISNNHSRMKEFRYGILPPFILILAPAAVLLVLQSHLSATIIVCLLVFSMMLLGGSSLHGWRRRRLLRARLFAVLNLPFVKELPLFKEKAPAHFPAPLPFGRTRLR